MKWRSVKPKPALERWMLMARGPRADATDATDATDAIDAAPPVVPIRRSVIGPFRDRLIFSRSWIELIFFHYLDETSSSLPNLT